MLYITGIKSLKEDIAATNVLSDAKNNFTITVHPVESRSICRPSVDRYSADISDECRSIYRPIVSTDTTYSKHDPTRLQLYFALKTNLAFVNSRKLTWSAL